MTPVERYVRFVIRRRVWVVGLVLLISLGAGAVMTRAVIASSLGKLFFGDAPHYLDYVERIREFGTDDVVLLAIEDVDVLSPDVLDRLEAAADRIREHDSVERVTSILDAQRVRRVGDTLRIDSYASLARKDPARKAELLEELRQDPMAGGLMVSEDGRHLLVIIELIIEDRSVEGGPDMVQAFLDAAAAAGFDPEQLHRAGFPALMAEMMVQTRYGLQVIFPIVAVVLLFVVWLLFHRLWPVAVTLVVSMLGVLWTMGMSVLMDPEISVMHSLAPVVILIVGFSDVIHLCSAYLLELSHGKQREEAIIASASEVGRACFYTSITTFVGFVALTFVPTPAFRMLGIILGIGVATALLLAMTLVPILFSWMRTPKPWRVGATSRIQGALDAVLAATSRLVLARPWQVIGGFAVAFGITLVGLANLSIDTTFTDRFDEDNPIAKDAAFFQASFGGSATIDLFVEATGPGVIEAMELDDEFAELEAAMDEPDDPPPPSQGGRDALFDPDVFARLARFHEAALAHPEVARVGSIVGLYGRIHRQLAPESAEPLPTTRAGLAEYGVLFEGSGGRDLGRLVDFDRRTAHLAVRLNHDLARGAFEVGEDLEQTGRELFGDTARVESSGLMWLMGGWLGEIIAGQRRGLLFTFAGVAILMVIGLRSVRMGLWSMIPNALPLLMLGGICGLVWDPLDSDTLILAMLAIGIGVDDTIHFLMRYRIEVERTADRAEAIQRTYDYAGRAIVMTTTTLALGFAPQMLSGYFSTWIMGSLLPLTLILALLADLLLVPALARVGLLD